LRSLDVVNDNLNGAKGQPFWKLRAKELSPFVNLLAVI
jgi:hypothetical protein